MTADLLARAQAGDGDAFGQLVDPYRRELQVHCYRFLGSVARRRGRAARHLAVGLAGPGWVRGTRLGPDLAVPGRHEPLPGRAAIGPPAAAGQRAASRAATARADPAGRAAVARALPRRPARGPSRQRTRARSPVRGPGIDLARLHHRPAAVAAPPARRLILRDVLGSMPVRPPASSDTSRGVGDQRAQARPRQRWSATSNRQASENLPRRLTLPAEQQLIDRLTRAFETADVDGIVAMLTEDAWLTMPPLPLEYQGRELAARFLTATAFRPGWTARLIPTRANGQPAFGFYARDPQTGGFYTVGLMVLTLSGTRVSAMTRFDSSTLPRFGLPATLPD